MHSLGARSSRQSYGASVEWSQRYEPGVREVHQDQEHQYSMETGARLCLKHPDAARKGKCKQSKKSPPVSRHGSPAPLPPELGTLPGAVTMCPI